MPTSPQPQATTAAASRDPAPAGVAVFERREFGRALAARVVPAQHWARLEELDGLLERVNALSAEVEGEVARARELGQAEGFAEGIRRAQLQMTEQLTALNERRARVLADAAGRITELACAIVARVAPGFDAASVVPPLVMQAVEAAQAEQFLLIRVHPGARASVQAGLGAVRQAHPAVGVIELVDDESLDPLSCVVVSEAGEVRAGVAQQIEAIRVALAGASQAGAGA
ncbi:FliH/SctL family protein [Luteimonas kalidii]|uniref:FliH/SctL family protein n=1 Tax=Luteimonas kalidii TaxID=3042025 RepID=A0ABT6JWB8_9GAMM|nr:FliH/SctL family protein [Luteimonas kalidii]MDH5834466.1 FliH/SctL family protein [Luteimonas kalidii]